MAWTTPRTWVAGETVTAALLNTHLRDNLNAIGDPGAWSTYNVSWTAATTNPVIGNGSVLGKYKTIGKTVDFAVRISMGSTTTFGSGAWSVTIPVPTAGALPVGNVAGFAYHGGNGYVLFSDVALSATTVSLYGNGTGLVSATVPFTWVNGDVLQISGTYESA